jgi:cell division protein FtsQ
VLQFHADCLKEFSGSGLIVTAVALCPRGGCKLALASGASIEVGRENARERLKRFLDAWPKLIAGRTDTLAYVDLRYENGFALRWTGDTPVAVKTVPLASAARRAGIGNWESGIGRADLATVLRVRPFPILHSRFPALS